MTTTPDPFLSWQHAIFAPIGSAFSVTLGKMLDAGRAVEDSHTTLPYIRAANIQDDGLRLNDVNEMPFSATEARRLDLREGDLLVVEGGAVGTCVVLDHDMPGWSFQKTVNRLRPTNDWSTRYLAYVLRTYRDAGIIDLICNGSTISHLTAEKLRALRIPVVQPEKQQAIADFLDHETEQIDALVAKQEEFIEFLRERRAGLIASAVAGLERGAEVESDHASWLGSCPPGWTRGQIKHFGSVTLGKMLQSDNKGSDVLAPYMRAANVQPDGELALTDVKSMWFSPHELRTLDLRAGDVVVVEGGIGGYGRAAFISVPLEGWGFQNSINRIRPLGENDGRYLTYFLIMARQKGFITAYCNIVSMPHLTAEKLAAMPMMIPPLSVQRQIADRLDKQTAQIDALIAKAKEHIAYAKERRAALITAAVTGLINVPTLQKAG